MTKVVKAKPVKKPKLGPVVEMTDDKVTAICDLIIEGKTLVDACKIVKHNRTSFLRCISRPSEDAKRWHDQYMEARRIQVTGWIDELLEISNGPGAEDDYKERIHRDTLKFRTRQWMMARLAPRIFGDKVQQEITGKEGGPVQLQQVIDAPQSESYEQFKARKEKEKCLVTLPAKFA